MKRKSIEDAIEELRTNLGTVARVSEWAVLMGYKNPKLFSRHFLRHFRRRPSEVLKKVRIKSIIIELRRNGEDCLQTAWKHSIPDEKALYNYVKRHMDCSPTEVKGMDEKELENLINEKFREDIFS